MGKNETKQTKTPMQQWLMKPLMKKKGTLKVKNEK